MKGAGLFTALLLTVGRCCHAYVAAHMPRHHDLRGGVPQLALSPAQQYAEQQREMRERRQRRMEAEMEAENGGSADDPEAAAKKALFEAELAAFESANRRTLAVFNSGDKNLKVKLARVANVTF